MDDPWENPRQAATHTHYRYGQSESSDTQIHQQIIAQHTRSHLPRTTSPCCTSTQWNWSSVVMPTSATSILRS